MSSNFTTTTHAKAILCGEHAVLRGHPIIVLPVRSHTLILDCMNDNELSADFNGLAGEDLHLLFWSVIEHGLELIDKRLSQINGRFSLTNTIPVGAGLGGSAALCVAVARWFIHQGWIAADDCFSFAKNLEHLFHGQSSGVDIAGSMSDNALWFEPSGDTPRIEALNPRFNPCLMLSATEQLAMTSHCVKKVSQLFIDDNATAIRIDCHMRDSVLLAKEALSLTQSEGLPLLAKAINQARVCFSQWGLSNEQLDQHVQQCLKNGALAAKPTGSGAGGFVLSLYDSPPEKTQNTVEITLSH